MDGNKKALVLLTLKRPFYGIPGPWVLWPALRARACKGRAAVQECSTRRDF